ncbi:SigE family RNA polymerase sigma factor [Cellulomonas triticagri]|uniref:SigE family RNA polymerase sigma factor n=1 Tax=Cellulomonas triticagri TaxID=2483352 RepID=A0A3M2ITU7_9CELL|nr:SigE family RNA polymerase sigma factor [Cellulomonas triticagri]
MTARLAVTGPESTPTPRVVPFPAARAPEDGPGVVIGTVDLPGASRDAPDHGPAATLDDLVRTHLPGLLRYATILVGDEHTAADLVQEVLLRAHVRWHRIALTERPDLYLRRMVTNEHLSWRRRWHVRTIRPASDEVLAAHADVARDHAHGLTEHDAMWRRLADLPARQRTVLVLRYYEGLADVDIAAVLGTSAATVRSHASRALTTLRATDPTSEETR